MMAMGCHHDGCQAGCGGPLWHTALAPDLQAIFLRFLCLEPSFGDHFWKVLFTQPKNQKIQAEISIHKLRVNFATKCFGMST